MPWNTKTGRAASILPCIGAILLLATFVPAADAQEEKGPLVEYVGKEDPSFGWSKKGNLNVGGLDVAELILTSQTWRNITWKHQLFIVRPSSVTKDGKHGVLVIAGGKWHERLQQAGGALELPGNATLFATIADQFQCPVAVLLQVPHQPIFQGKVEDAIIAYTMAKFLETGDVEWPLLLPMVKSAVKAMDAVQQFCRKEWDIQLESFTVTGASKRGWTTWLTGAVDERATAIAPMVIDMLNMSEQMKHQVDAWGALSERIHDYTERRLPQRLTTDAGEELRKIVDPYAYRDLLRQPKLIIIATNDHYWPLDALNLYWDGLLGEKYILYIPNNRHGIRDYSRVIGSIKAMHEQAQGGRKMPSFTWKFDDRDGKVSLQMQSKDPPGTVRVWLATSATRDFRQSRWRSVTVRGDGGQYVYSLSPPTSGYEAVLGEAVYRVDEIPCFLSTNVRIVPTKE